MTPISRKGRPAAACWRMRRAISSTSRSMPGALTRASAGRGRGGRGGSPRAAPGGAGAAGAGVLPGEAHGSEALVEDGGEILVAEGEGEIGVGAHGGDDAQFGIGQGVKAIHVDGVDAVQSVAGDVCGGQFQAAGAGGERAAGEVAVDFPGEGGGGHVGWGAPGSYRSRGSGWRGKTRGARREGPPVPLAGRARRRKLRWRCRDSRGRRWRGFG